MRTAAGRARYNAVGRWYKKWFYTQVRPGQIMLNTPLSLEAPCSTRFSESDRRSALDMVQMWFRYGSYESALQPLTLEL